MGKKGYSFSWKGKYIYGLAFFLPFVLLVGFMIITKAAPFGRYSIIQSDTLSQIYPFLCELHRKLYSGDSLWFSWNMGMGNDFYTTVLYYLMSPANWIVALFPEQLLVTALSFSIVIQVSLSAAAMTFYFMHSEVLKQLPGKKLYALLAGLAYGLSNAVLCYYFMSLWLFSYILFPFVLYGLECLIYKKKPFLYYVLLLLLMISNFYMACIVCVFLVLWYIYQTDWNTFRERLPAFLGYSILAAMSAASVLLPALFALMAKKRYDDSQINYWKIQNIWNMLNKLLPFSEVDSLGVYYSTYNVYCGSIVLLAALCYLLFGKDKTAKRVKLTLLLLFMSISLCAHCLIYFWHGFTFPHGFNNRFSFMTVFVLIYAGIKGFAQLYQTTYLKLFFLTIALAALFAGSIRYTDFIGYPGTYVTVMLVWAFIIILAFLYTKKSISQKVFTRFIIVISIAELCANAEWALLQVGVGDWQNRMADLDSVYEDLGQSEGRTAYSELEFHNEGSIYGVKSGGIFSSLIHENIVAFYDNMGLYYVPAGSAYVYSGATPFTNLLTNMQTAVTERVSAYAGMTVLSRDNYQVMKLDGGTGFGFMYSPSGENGTFDSVDVYENQNRLFAYLGGEGKLFTGIDTAAMEFSGEMLLTKQKDAHTIGFVNTLYASPDGKVIQLTEYDAAKDLSGYSVVLNGTMEIAYEAEQDMDLYFYIGNASGSLTSVKVDDVEIKESGDQKTFYENLHVGQVKKGQRVVLRITNSGTDAKEDTLVVYAAAFNQEIFDHFVPQVEANPFVVEEMNGKGLSGQIEAQKAGSLFLSVVDDGGFTVYVDGKKASHRLLSGCLISVDIPAGIHKITLKYFPPGLSLGLIISGIGIGLVAFFLIYGRKSRAE